MRTRRQLLNENMEVMSDELIEYGWVSSDLDLLLGRKGLEDILIRSRTESGELVQVLYSAWQFECPVCGSYDHTEAECPELLNEMDEATP